MKKRKVDLDSLDVDEVLQETVACYILGRVLASYGGILTKKETTNSKNLFSLIRSGQIPSEDLPVTAENVRIKKEDVQKYTPAQAIKAFAKAHPKYAQPLLRMLEETCLSNVPAVKYGLKPEKTLQDNYCIDILQTYLSLDKSQARSLYEKVIKPHLESEKVDSGLIQKLMKD